MRLIARPSPRRLTAPFTLALAALLVAAAVARPAWASPADKPTVKFVLEDGATVADIAHVVARASTTDDSGIDKVDFYVDDDLKFTDTSTPYEFDWDTLAGSEGKHTLSAVATDSKGATAKATIAVTVDNELGKGAEAHAQTALAALKEGDLDKATRYARRALKIDPKNLDAARAYAGILRRKGDLAKALDVLDKVDLPANDTATRADLVAMHIDLADASDNTDDFLKQAAAAIEIYKKLQSVRAAEAAAAPGSAPSASGDALFNAHDYQGAVAAYQKCGPAVSAPVPCTNRLILTYMASGTPRSGVLLAHELERDKRADATTQALLAMDQLNARQFSKARDMVQPGVEARNLPSLIVAAYADLALDQMAKARDEADQAYAIGPDLAVVNLLRGFTLADPIDGHKAIIRALEIDPMLPEAYVHRAWQSMSGGDAGRFQVTDQLLDFAQKLDPTNTYTLLAKAVSFVAQRRPNEAQPILDQLLQQDPNAADVHVVAAVNYTLLDQFIKVAPQMDIARKLDPNRWQEAFVPKPLEIVGKVYRARISPVLSPAALYPAG